MRKIISFMHITLDGFVAGPNGELNWAKVDQELFDYVGNRIKTGDTALYGRKTYQILCFYSSAVQVDSLVLRNPPERKARKCWQPMQTKHIQADDINVQ